MIGVALSPFISSLLGGGQRAMPPISLIVRLEDGSTSAMLARPEAAASYVNLFGRE